METKAFWRSKAFWGGVMSIITGLGILVQGGSTVEAIAAIAGGVVAIVGRVQASQPLGLTAQEGKSDAPPSSPVDAWHIDPQ